jgi:hypothetical protein
MIPGEALLLFKPLSFVSRAQWRRDNGRKMSQNTGKYRVSGMNIRPVCDCRHIGVG